MGHLQAEPHVRGAAEGFGEAQRHFGGDAGGAVDELAEGLAADAQGLGTLSDGEAGGLETVELDREAGVWGVEHGAEGGFGHVCHLARLVLVDQLDARARRLAKPTRMRRLSRTMIGQHSARLAVRRCER